MSSYQYYEFLAVDRPLDAKAQAEMRALSSRAQITATSFVNEYHWGDFSGSPEQLMQSHYDAHLYLADWGTRRVMFRLPTRLLTLSTVEPYCVDNRVTAWVKGRHLVLELVSEDDAGEEDLEPDGLLSSLVGVRAELAAGDHRGLYPAWLAGYGTWERDEHACDSEEDAHLEPPVPVGLGTLTAPQRALADFLRLDEDLLAVAVENSRPLDETTGDAEGLAIWLGNLTTAEKNRLLLRVVTKDAQTRGPAEPGSGSACVSPRSRDGVSSREPSGAA
ncbi:hypothetical protein [Parafrankia sp. FMc2]|uniref:hypothetical protein n=1 Tax=Parafrankia sp. FMc2 TaxID=3233196 RepID=UPI0034D6666A